MPKDWFIRKNGKTYGPMSTSNLKAAAKAGKLAREDKVSNSKDGPWHLVTKVKGLDLAGKDAQTQQAQSSHENATTTKPEIQSGGQQRTTEEPVAESIYKSIPGAAIEGAEIVGVKPNADAKTKLKAINRFLTPKKHGWLGKKANPNIDNWTERSLPIGCLWGETMVQHFGWNWANLIQHDHDDFEVIAVVNDDRSLAIFPWHYCFGCLESDLHPTILLAFNMLEAGKIPKQDPRSFVNLMDGVHHIVPPG